jgi:hypothetical protein
VPLDYKLLLGHNWTYAIVVVISYVLCTLCFPHDGKIMMIDQLSFAYASPNASVRPSIPMIDNSQPTTENFEFGMYSFLMGIFNLIASIHHIYVMSNRLVSSERSIPFLTSYFSDPWTLPSSTSSCEGQSYDGMAMPLSIMKIVYQVVLDSFDDTDLVTSLMDEEDIVLKPVWAT